VEARANTLVRQQIQEFICPVTTDIMFEPVMISGCGHMVEGRVSSSLRKCPHCRGEEQNKGITVVAVPPVVTSMLARTLAAEPNLWQQVYLDHDYLADTLRREELKTPAGERFIKLLENNTVDNLNDKAVDGKQVGKSVIEILANHYIGRNLLRSNEKIQALISDETKVLTVDGKTIVDWLAMENEEKPVVEEKKKKKVRGRHQPSRNSLFAGNARPARQVEDNVWQRVVYGNEDGVLELLRCNASLVTEKRTVIDYSDREVDDATPFQMALRAGDEVMAEKIKDLYLRANPENGQQELDNQFNEIFPDGYESHLRAQQQAADDFERDYLNPLIEAITNASRQDLDAALAKQYNDSVLHQRLTAFKTAFDELSKNEKIYNPNHLLKAFKKYDENFDRWRDKFNDNHWRHVDLFWRQVIGWQQRYMTTNYAQSFCTGLANMFNDGRPLQRTLGLRHYANGRAFQFFPLERHGYSNLGSDFGICSYGWARCECCGWRFIRAWRPGRSVLQNLCQTKTANLGELCVPRGIIAHRAGV